MKIVLLLLGAMCLSSIDAADDRTPDLEQFTNKDYKCLWSANIGRPVPARTKDSADALIAAYFRTEPDSDTKMAFWCETEQMIYYKQGNDTTHPSIEPPQSVKRFSVGEPVNVKDKRGYSDTFATWIDGTVTSVEPLKVKTKYSDNRGNHWDFVVYKTFRVGDRVLAKDRKGSEIATTWKEGTVTSLAPLKVRRDGTTKIYEWDNVMYQDWTGGWDPSNYEGTLYIPKNYRWQDAEPNALSEEGIEYFRCCDYPVGYHEVTECGIGPFPCASLDDAKILFPRHVGAGQFATFDAKDKELKIRQGNPHPTRDGQGFRKSSVGNNHDRTLLFRREEPNAEVREFYEALNLYDHRGIGGQLVRYALMGAGLNTSEDIDAITETELRELGVDAWAATLAKTTHLAAWNEFVRMRDYLLRLGLGPYSTGFADYWQVMNRTHPRTMAGQIQSLNQHGMRNLQNMGVNHLEAAAAMREHRRIQREENPNGNNPAFQ